MSTTADHTDPDEHAISPEELAELDASRERYLRGEGTWYTLEQLETRMKQRIEERDLSETSLSQQEWDAVEKDREAYLRGEGKNTTWEEIKERWRKEKP